MVGKRVLHYQVVAQIGRGGMGVVWKAVDTRLEREVALKFLPEAATVDPARRERFLREAKAASALNHPNIVTIYEVNSESGQLFIAMELVRGQSLSVVLRERGRLPASVAVGYALQLCAGLGAAHRVGIVHRDIKPGNIMVTDDGLIKILDFGLAKLTAPAEEARAGSVTAPISTEGTAVGTVPYMSPEQVSGDVVGPRSDVFSVGVVLYEMLTGVRPFRGASKTDIIRAVLSHEPAALSSLAPDVPEALAQIVETCLQKTPGSRYQDAHEMASHLREIEHVAGPLPESSEATVTMELPAPAPDPHRNRRYILAAAVLLALTALFAAYFWRFHPSRRAAAPMQAETVERAQTLLQRFDRKGNVDSAIALLKPLAAQAGANASIHAALAEAYVRKYNESDDDQWLPKAVESGRTAVRITQDLAAAHVALGMALAASGRKTEAAAEFERARDLNPLSGPAHTGLAKLRSDDEAEKLFRKSIALSPGQWIPYNELGAFYWRKARYSESVVAWSEALRLEPGSVAAIRNLGAGFHMLGQYAEAADKFQRALELDETNATTWANLGTSRYFQGRYLDAVRAAEKSVALAPSRYLYWGNLGDAYRWADGMKSKAGDAYNNAIRLLREQMARAPNDAALNIRLAAYLAKSGDTSAALKELAAKRDAMENNSRTLFNAALVYELAGDRTNAIDVLQRAILAGYSMHEITHEPDLANLRSDARFSPRAAGQQKE